LQTAFAGGFAVILSSIPPRYFHSWFGRARNELAGKLQLVMCISLEEQDKYKYSANSALWHLLSVIDCLEAALSIEMHFVAFYLALC
jgi:hypothetical protein